MSFSKKHIIQFLQWILVIAAYAYLAYRLTIYDDWSSLGEHFSNAGIFQYLCILVAVLLFPVNILFESMKWRYLLKDIEPMSLREAQRQTYFGFIGAFLTPSRLGDYPARVTMMKNKNCWLEAIILGFIGTLALAFLQVMVGMPSCIIILERVGGLRWVEWLCVGMLFLQIITIVFYPILSRKISPKLEEGKLKNTLLVLSVFSYKRFFVTFLLSLLRYSVYCLQLWLVMYFCGVELGLHEAIVAIPAYYLLITVTPSVPVADAAIRGSWSMVIFGLFSTNIAAIAISAVLLWVLNTILPMLIGSFLPHFSLRKKRFHP